MATCTVKIERFNPEFDEKPHIDSFEVEFTQEKTVLDALEEIKADQDGSVTFRRSCRHAICGSCAVNINGRNSLACKQPLRNNLNRKREITLRPLSFMPVIKDLVVDRSAFWEQYRRVKPWLVPPENQLEKEFQISPEEVAALKSAEKCIMCGACYSSCPVVATKKDYIGPHALLKSFLRVLDARDTILVERLDELEQQQGIYGCHTVSTCIDACPKGLVPTEAISTLRLIAQKRKAFEEKRQARQAAL